MEYIEWLYSEFEFCLVSINKVRRAKELKGECKGMTEITVNRVGRELRT